MKKILHVTPKGSTLYTMPDETFALVEQAIGLFGSRRGIDFVIGKLPVNARATITTEKQKPHTEKISGNSGSIIFSEAPLKPNGN